MGSDASCLLFFPLLLFFFIRRQTCGQASDRGGKQVMVGETMQNEDEDEKKVFLVC